MTHAPAAALEVLPAREDVVALAPVRCAACGVVLVHLADGVEMLDGSAFCLPCGRAAFRGTSAESEFERGSPRRSSARAD